MDHISYRSRACRNAMEYSDLAPVAPERQVILDKRDAEARCRAKKAGISFLSRAFFLLSVHSELSSASFSARAFSR